MVDEARVPYACNSVGMSDWMSRGGRQRLEARRGQLGAFSRQFRRKMLKNWGGRPKFETITVFLGLYTKHRRYGANASFTEVHIHAWYAL